MTMDSDNRTNESAVTDDAPAERAEVHGYLRGATFAVVS